MFGARIGGTWQVMRMSIADRSRQQLTVDGGYAAHASPDGRAILFTRLERARRVVDGDRGRPLDAARAWREGGGKTVNWNVTPNGIYYVGTTADQIVIRRAPLNRRPLCRCVPGSATTRGQGFAVTRDGPGDLRALAIGRSSAISDDGTVAAVFGADPLPRCCAVVFHGGIRFGPASGRQRNVGTHRSKARTAAPLAALCDRQDFQIKPASKAFSEYLKGKFAIDDVPARRRKLAWIGALPGAI
jgi:hypothetical protein